MTLQTTTDLDALKQLPDAEFTLLFSDYPSGPVASPDAKASNITYAYHQLFDELVRRWNALPDPRYAFDEAAANTSRSQTATTRCKDFSSPLPVDMW